MPGAGTNSAGLNESLHKTKVDLFAPAGSIVPPPGRARKPGGFAA
nr:MAG TPA: hypothetical protein [Caudoviricetes sp.]